MPKAKNRAPQTKAKHKYNAKAYDSFLIYVKKGYKACIKEQADKTNVSFNEYVKDAILRKMESEGLDVDLIESSLSESEKTSE